VTPVRGRPPRRLSHAKVRGRPPPEGPQDQERPGLSAGDLRGYRAEGHLVRALVEAHYIFPEAAATVSEVLATGLAGGRYPADLPALATAVTADLQSVNGDKHLRLEYHEEAIPPRTPGDDTEEYAAMARWADQTCGGVACAQRLAGNVGYLDLRPVLFPAVLCGAVITAAMSLLATADALIIDLRGCLGGEPGMVAFLISYLWDQDPAQLSGLRERRDNQLRQTWTLPYVPGRASARTSRCTC
jgi:N-terminal domain of Peptidase_S41 in eukaryotic IRBP